MLIHRRQYVNKFMVENRFALAQNLCGVFTFSKQDGQRHAHQREDEGKKPVIGQLVSRRTATKVAGTLIDPGDTQQGRQEHGQTGAPLAQAHRGPGDVEKHPVGIRNGGKPIMKPGSIPLMPPIQKHNTPCQHRQTQNECGLGEIPGREVFEWMGRARPPNQNQGRQQHNSQHIALPPA